MTPYRIERRALICKYLDKFPDSPNRMLARMLYRDNPSFFNDIEDARGLVRMYRGVRGKHNRKTMSFTKYYKNEL